MVYTIADANEYLVITGYGIEDVKIVKRAWVWPLQRCSRISVLPDDYSSNALPKLHALRTSH
jgi:flotillin